MIYFMVTGDAAFVLPSFENVRYINVRVGDHFGVIDIPSSAEKLEFNIDDWFEKKNLLQRQFTVMAMKNVEVQILSLQNLYRMQ